MIKLTPLLLIIALTGCANIGQFNHALPGGSTYLANQRHEAAQAAWYDAAVMQVAGDNEDIRVQAGVDMGELWDAVQDADRQKMYAIVFDVLKGAVYSWAVYEYADEEFRDHGSTPTPPITGDPNRATITAANKSVISIRDADHLPNITVSDGSAVAVDLSQAANIERNIQRNGK